MTSLPLPAGAEIAGYTLAGVLGRGGMAVVYRATRADRPQPIALKVIDVASWGADAQHVLERESRLAAAVAHRHILPVYEAGEHEGLPYVVMKLERCDLASVLRRLGRLGPARACDVVAQVASALDAAHAHGLVHRDVKPSNVLLGDDEEGRERAYVADFGVARAAFSSGEAYAGDMVGTVGYISPEQIRGGPVDQRTDVYALGCLLYECLTGKVPFRRPSSMATLWAHLHEEPPLPSVLVPDLPQAIDAVVASALQKDAMARYGSAGALAEAALEAIDGRRPARVRRETPRGDLPSGLVTFLFTDVEGPTRLLHTLGAERYAEELEEHRRAIREACAIRGGVEVDTQGDAFFFAFPTAEGALEAARDATETLSSGPIRVRIGLHTGTPHLTSEGYVGADVHRAARIASAGHGGQVLVSEQTADLLGSRDVLVSLGAHRLRDFDGPVTLYQVGQGSFPALKTIANTNLPSPTSSFLGREEELYEAGLLLQATRLLTIAGPGGQGKTRFALELARRAREERFSDYEDGVFSCFLAPLRDPSLVLATVAQALALREEAGSSALDTVSSHLAGKRMLLLLDNLEHVLACGPELGRLLAACPGLTLLVTSRELLRLQGERPYSLPPLAVDESVALFCERARLEPTAAIEELCGRLEGLPLAIELAAARTSLLSAEQLLERLSQRLDLLKGSRDAEPRQQTLRATIEWSHDLLSVAERALFARLSVFAGGCTLEAAEEVCDADLDTLEGLLDKSLVRRMDGRSGPRFWMLETLREFASECLSREHDPDEVRLRHARHFAAVARAAAPELRGSNAGSTVERLELDLENFRAAFAHCRAAGEGELALELATELFFLWQWRGRNVEAGEWLEAALAEPGVGSAGLRAKALNRAGIAADERGESQLARRRNEESVALARAAGDRETEAAALHDLANSYGEAGELVEAARRYKATLPLFEELGEISGLVVAMSNLGMAYRRLGRLDEALPWHREAVRLGRELRNDYYLVIALSELGVSALEAHGPDEGVPLIREAVQLAIETGNLGLLPWSLWWLSVAAARGGSPEAAARLAGAAERLLEDSGRELDDYDSSWIAAGLAPARAAIGDRAFEAARAEGAALSAEEAVEYALREPG